MPATTSTHPGTANAFRARTVLRRLGVAGFAFFLVKGILWLVLPAVLWALRG